MTYARSGTGVFHGLFEPVFLLCEMKIPGKPAAYKPRCDAFDTQGIPTQRPRLAHPQHAYMQPYCPGRAASNAASPVPVPNGAQPFSTYV